MREVEHLEHTLIGDPVKHEPMLTTSGHEAAPAQTGQMRRNGRLRQRKPSHQISDGQLTLVAQQLEDPHTRRVAEAPEVLRHQIDAHRHNRQTERC